MHRRALYLVTLLSIVLTVAVFAASYDAFMYVLSVFFVLSLFRVITSSFFFFFNDTATTEIYTPFPTRRSSDLSSRKVSCLAGWYATKLSTPSVLADRKSTRLNSSHSQISYAVFCLKKKTETSVNSLVH